LEVSEAQHERAAKQLTATLEMDPNFAFAHWVLGGVYLQKPALGNFIAEYQRALDLEKSSPRYIGGLGVAYAVSEPDFQPPLIGSTLQGAVAQNEPGAVIRLPQRVLRALCGNFLLYPPRITEALLLRNSTGTLAECFWG
jgi:hypothetical protein